MAAEFVPNDINEHNDKMIKKILSTSKSYSCLIGAGNVDLEVDYMNDKTRWIDTENEEYKHTFHITNIYFDKIDKSDDAKPVLYLDLNNPTDLSKLNIFKDKLNKITFDWSTTKFFSDEIIVELSTLLKDNGIIIYTPQKLCSLGEIDFNDIPIEERIEISNLPKKKKDKAFEEIKIKCYINNMKKKFENNFSFGEIIQNNTDYIPIKIRDGEEIKADYIIITKNPKIHIETYEPSKEQIEAGEEEFYKLLEEEEDNIRLGKGYRDTDGIYWPNSDNKYYKKYVKYKSKYLLLCSKK